MISKWGVTNFKSIREANLDLAPLTIFTGTNSSGKSSFLDSIAIAAQFHNEGEEEGPKKHEIKFKPNNDLVQLGEVRDIFHYNASKHESIDFDFIMDYNYHFKFSLMPYKPNTLIMETDTMRKKNIEGFVIEQYEDPEMDHEIELERDDIEGRLYNYFSPSVFQYLGPFRNPPLLPNKKEFDGKDVLYVNSDGSNTFAVLNKLYNEDVPYCFPDIIEKREYDKKKSYTLIHTLDRWLKYFELCDTCKVDDNGVLKFYIDGKIYTLPQLGSGVSQILPILVMCLTAQNQITINTAKKISVYPTIIIKEPESHFHPKVQSRLADLFIAMALSGRQCLIETHSEYLIYMLRYHISQSLLRNDKSIQNVIKILYTEKNEGKTNFHEIKVNRYGEISAWPDGFFDERQKMSDMMLEGIISEIDI